MGNPAFKFEIHGLKETMDALEQLPTLSMKKRVVRDALKKAAEPIRDKAQQNAAWRSETEQIAESIQIGTSLKRSQRGRQDRTRVTAYIGATHPLAHLFEFGTAERYTKGKKSVKAGVYRGFIPAMPFLRNAWDEKKRVSLDILKDELWKSLEKAAKLLSKKAMKGTLTAGQRKGLLR